MAKHRIAVLHLRLKQMAKKSNLEVVRRLARSVDGSAKILVLPSLFNTGPIFEHYRGHRLARVLKNAAEKIPGPTSDLLSVLAVEKAVFILGGPIVERAGPRIFLTTLAYSPSGELLCKYRKIVVEEAEEALGISPGKKPGLVELDVGYGIMAGSDVFYPEVARTLVLSGATMLVAMLRMSRRYAAIVDLLRLRSMENNVPMIIVGGAAEIHGE
ncbi:MAG: carbon-nitrogen hydrolase family protein, partial [Candidatus Korarchaeota archaeon]|nr:carbon-nitrogen hydrolase family protein [Candidatus Korarchaeota archaeon]